MTMVLMITGHNELSLSDKRDANKLVSPAKKNINRLSSSCSETPDKVWKSETKRNEVKPRHRSTKHDSVCQSQAFHEKCVYSVTPVVSVCVNRRIALTELEEVWDNKQNQ